MLPNSFSKARPRLKRKPSCPAGAANWSAKGAPVLSKPTGNAIAANHTDLLVNTHTQEFCVCALHAKPLGAFGFVILCVVYICVVLSGLSCMKCLFMQLSSTQNSVKTLTHKNKNHAQSCRLSCPASKHVLAQRKPGVATCSKCTYLYNTASKQTYRSGKQCVMNSTHHVRKYQPE